MKPEPFNFRKPIKIFQVFRNINEYKKDEKSFEDRKDKLVWNPMQSTSGYVKDGLLYLPKSIIEHPNFDTYDIISMLDDNFSPPQNVFLTREKNHLFKHHSLNKLDAFVIRSNQKIEFYLNYGYFSVGTPKRDNFKVFELKLNQPVEIKINGKVDFTGSGRWHRSFMEQAYIFEYIGEFKSCFLLKEPIEVTVKQIPATRKVVDLNKRLW